MRSTYRHIARVPIAVGILVMGMLWSAQARAVGYGAALKYGNTEGDLSPTQDGTPPRPDLDVTTRGLELGFVLDTNVARDRLFNYRLRVSFEYAKWDNLVDVDAFGASVTNTFGFGIFRNRSLRLFAGPDIRLALTAGTNSVGFDLAQIDLTVGPSIGANFHLGPVSLSATIAYYPQLTIVATTGAELAGDDFVGVTHRVTAGVAFMFRSRSDNYGVTAASQAKRREERRKAKLKRKEERRKAKLKRREELRRQREQQEPR